MADNIDNLLSRIQKEGIERADIESGKILSQARHKADSLVKEAEAKSAVMIKNAEADTKVMIQRAEKALEQAARDVILQVREDLSEILSAIAKQEAGSTLKSAALEQLIVKVADAYMSGKERGSINVLVAPDQQKAVTDMLMSKLAAQMKSGLTVKSDNAITAGFKVFEEKGKITHDFTDAAVAAMLNQLLRPVLAKIVNNALTNP